MLKKTLIAFGLGLFSMCAMAEDFVDDLIYFHVGEGDIGCAGWLTKKGAPNGITFVGCSVNSELITHKYKLYGECAASSGGNFSVSERGKAGVECSFDTYSGGENSKKLKKGEVVSGYNWQCKGVGNDGVICKDKEGNGFLLKGRKQVVLNKKR